MKAIIPSINENTKRPYYLQLYDYLKESILSGEINQGEKLPSLRSLSKELKLSITTVELAYNQLAVEGYIYSRPKSGYYAGDIFTSKTAPAKGHQYSYPVDCAFDTAPPDFFYDPHCFDFNKWKKCTNKVLTEYTPLLFFESDPQGETALRQEIAKYLYQSRGVICQPDQIVIGAGTQQITNHLSVILRKLGIDHVAVEEPGYIPVKRIFKDRGFALTPVQVNSDGINIHKLPSNIKSAVYTSPSNHVPTGAVMPAGKRYELLDWAVKNNSIIIEDDYDSELRYFGKPIPALQGLDTHERVVYLGSFSSTLFSAIKISYMVLPAFMAEIFQSIRSDYTQTCSKIEQLTLALFMKQGFYQTNIKKQRSLYSQKLQKVIQALTTDISKPTNSSSGINIIVNVKSEKSAEQLCTEAGQLKIVAVPTASYTGQPATSTSSLILYYNQIPLKEISHVMADLIAKWKQV